MRLRVADAVAAERIAELEAELVAVNAAAHDTAAELGAARAEAALLREELAAAPRGPPPGLTPPRNQLQEQLQVGGGPSA